MDEMLHDALNPSFRKYTPSQTLRVIWLVFGKFADCRQIKHVIGGGEPYNPSHDVFSQI